VYIPALFQFVAKVPVLIFEAGLDRLVRSDGIERFRRRVPQARYRLFDGAYHDLFDETDDIRSVWRLPKEWWRVMLMVVR